jgi:hypothetical protein
VYSVKNLTLSGGPGFAATALITVNPLIVTLTPNKNSVYGLGSLKLEIALNKPAPAGGYVIQLKSNDPTVMPVPDSVTIGFGAQTRSIPLSTAEVAERHDVIITGGPGFAASTTIAVLPQGVKGIVLSPNSLLGGASSTATVTLTGPAPTGGAEVSFDTTNPSAIKVPIKIVIPQGSTTGTAQIETYPTGTDTSGYVSATFNSTARALLTVKASEVISFSADTSVNGGSSFNASLTLNNPAPAGGLKVSIISDKDAIPSTTITIPEGAVTYAFQLASIPVQTDTGTVLVAKSSSLSASTTVTVMAPTIASAVLDNSSIPSGGKTGFTITISGPAPAGGLKVTLSSSSAAADLPTNVVIPGGLKSAKVTVRGMAVSNPTQATLTATYGASSKSAVLTVTPF